MNLIDELVAARKELRDRRKEQEVAHQRYRETVEASQAANSRYVKAMDALETHAAEEAGDLPRSLDRTETPS